MKYVLFQKLPSIFPMDRHPGYLSQHCKQSTEAEIFFLQPANNMLQEEPVSNKLGKNWKINTQRMDDSKRSHSAKIWRSRNYVSNFQVH